MLNRFLSPAGVAPRKIQEVMLTDVIIEMVRGGLGVAALAKWAVSPQLDSGALVGLSLTEQGFRRTWSAAQLRDARTPAHVEEFIRVLAENPIPQCVPRCRVAARKRAAA
jgi:LysR family transcriptional regulator for metE and metH